MAEFELKRLSVEAVPSALEKAQTYRLLNEPLAAESICRDVLEIEPDNVEAQIELLLSLSDQFPTAKPGLIPEAEALANSFKDEYRRHYFCGLVLERRGLAHLESRTPRAGRIVYAWLRDAMNEYEAAQKLKPAENDEAILRWNTCARIIMKHPEIREPHDTEDQPMHMFDS